MALGNDRSYTIPPWESLIGSLDFCSCEHFRSMYGLTAYLVDLLFFLREQGTEEKTALEVLFERRADIGKIELNCQNLKSNIQYKDLIHEVLEHYIVNAKTSSCQWLSVVEHKHDKLSNIQNTTLLDDTLNIVMKTHPEIRSVNDLSNFFLMDFEMDPYMITSRIEQAISSVQLFMQRCLTNLENKVELEINVVEHWNQHKKNYSVWKANRKIFLYPENWIEPELRHDKSPIFEDLENELQQYYVTKDTVKTAFLNYLEKIADIARLEDARYIEHDFTSKGDFRSYKWELFFHVPLLIASRLSAHQQFDEAQKWYHLIFDPTDVSDEHSEMFTNRFKKIKSFFEYADKDNIEKLLRLLDTEDPANQALQVPFNFQIKDWLENPSLTNLTNLRLAYHKAIVMKYLDNIITWGDQLFRRDTIESINEATHLYILALQILGNRPEDIPILEGDKVINGKTIKTFNDLEPHLDKIKKILSQHESEIPTLKIICETPYEKLTIADIISSTLFFCVPRNEKLLGFWDIVEDRIYKIRNCMNIQGVVRQLGLYEPLLEPSLLVYAESTGIDRSRILNDKNSSPPKYRFHVILQKAIEFCDVVKDLGNAILSTIEKHESEELALLLSSYVNDLQNIIKHIHEWHLDGLKETIKRLEKNLESTKECYYFHTHAHVKQSNFKFYSWMVSQVYNIYFQIYELAYDIAKCAERAYHYELADYDTMFVKFDYWDNLKKGLLAGERLFLDLRCMEKAYIDSTMRD